MIISVIKTEIFLLPIPSLLHLEHGFSLKKTNFPTCQTFTPLVDIHFLTYGNNNAFIKDALSGLRQLLATECPLKMMKMLFISP